MKALLSIALLATAVTANAAPNNYGSPYYDSYGNRNYNVYAYPYQDSYGGSNYNVYSYPHLPYYEGERVITDSFVDEPLDDEFEGDEFDDNNFESEE